MKRGATRFHLQRELASEPFETSREIASVPALLLETDGKYISIRVRPTWWDALSSRGRKRPNADRVRRPMNAFMVWARINRPLLAKSFRGNNNADISIRLGQAWNALTHVQKDPFYREAEELKKQHREEHPGWVYSPRPPKQKNTGFSIVPSGDHANSLPNCKLNPNSTSYFTFSSNPRYVISQHGPFGIQPPMTHRDNAAGAQSQRPGTSGVSVNSQHAPPQAQQYVIEPVGPPRRPDSAQILRHAAAAGPTAVGQPAIQPVQILMKNPSSQIPQNKMVYQQANGGAVLHLVNEGRAQTAVNLTPNQNAVNILKGMQAAHVADFGYGAPPQAESVHATFGSSTGEERKNGNSSSPGSNSTASSSRHPRRCDVDLDDDERSLNLHIPDGGVDAAASELRTVVAPDVQLFQRFLSDLSGTDQQTRSGEWSETVQPEKSEEKGNDIAADDDDSIINVVT
ncbi:uncharacterized protein LOC117294683 [Asterias rubens]|uniref:uncharacterized protein LOC117294683 n=1 Tax=Asterias rubens TaxID=7604 RepID=UPI0014551023|nr:uncharacterized protein LOC117294683 [Asterias rubens]